MIKNRKEKDWFKNRGYLHFTNKTPLYTKGNVEKYVSNAQKIARHSFSPLILKHIKQRRYKNSSFNNIDRHSHKKVKNRKIVSNTKVRDILYATHIDAHIYSYYTKKIITPLYEKYLNENERKELSASVSAYRQIITHDNLKFKNNVHFAKDAFDEIKKRKECVALTFDIENFFLV